MVLSWTKGSRVFRRARKGKDILNSSNDLQVEIAIPTHFRCPITLDIMKDPVTLSTGITYDRDSIEKWIESGNNTCPVTKTELLLTTNFDNIVPNHSLRRMIQDWCVQHRSYGVERIPTPRIPVTPYEVTDTCTRILSAVQQNDEQKCFELVKKIKGWGKESERNKKCIVSNGAPIVLANVFDSFSRCSFEKINVVLLEEVLGMLTWMRPVSEQSRLILGSLNSLSCMVWFLNDKNQVSTRQNASLLIKEMHVESLMKIEGIVETLVNMVKVPIGSVSTKACLSTIFHLVFSSMSKKVVLERFVELGLVSILLEILVDAEKGVCEKALGVLDCLCDSKNGVGIAKSNALTLPLVIKKLLRVSELSSSFVVSIVYKICCDNKGEEEGVLIEAIQVGMFQKLLVLLQVGCGEITKEKATELLKLLNGYRSKAECVDSSSLDFMHLKKPF